MRHQSTSATITGKKSCHFCATNVKDIDFKDEITLRRFISSYGKIVPRRRSGVCSKHQRKLALAIKRARILGILPFTNK
ncbi:30S ribosomal protein S18 [Patescibacteria group bacterium]|nr:30S ribosomal protein S18 [Patescibacteria group bacterium]